MSNTSMLHPKQLHGSYSDGVARGSSMESGLRGNQAAPSHWTPPPTPAPGAPPQLEKKTKPCKLKKLGLHTSVLTAPCRRWSA